MSGWNEPGGKAMELLQLRYFQTAARLQSMTLAAKEWQIPQSAMSQAIHRLEKELNGIPLFDRANNRIQLNENGRLFLARVDDALAALDCGVQEVTRRQEDISGPLRLLVQDSSRFAIQCVAHFASLHPTVSFSICHDFYSSDKTAYDLCISASSVCEGMNRSVPLIREQLMLAIVETHPLAKRESIRLEELKDEGFITPSPGSCLYQMTVSSCRAAGFEPNIIISCDDTYYIRKYIAEGMGVTIAPSVSWAGRFRANTKLIPIDGPCPDSTTSLFWDDRKYQSAAVRAFRKYLQSEALLLENNQLRVKG